MSGPRRLRGPASRPADEGVALVIVVLAMLLLASFSVLTLSAVIGQAVPAQYQRKADLSVNTAQSGLNAALSAIRKATYVENGTTYGDRSKLPCWVGRTGTVTAPGTGTQFTYAVTIRYFAADPARQSETWRTQNALSCVTGVGTMTAPAFALITSAASGPGLPNLPAASGNRTLQGTYNFSLTNPNLPGGLIRDAKGLCYTGSTVVGTPVTLTTCTTGAENQTWSYNSSFQLVLTATAPTGSGGLCLAATPPTSTSNPVTAVMKTCVTTDFAQRWGVNGASPVHYFGYLDGSYSRSWCLGASSPGTVGSALVADNSTCWDGNRGVYPEAVVGPGGAGTTVRTQAEISGKALQWVNYQEFGRCLDINGWNLYGSIHIVYPCKQDPMVGVIAGAAPGWNEVFTWDSSTLYFYANRNYSAAEAFCMHSAGTEGGYITFSTPCANITAADRTAYQWTVNRDTGAYGTSYTIVDGYGRCLSNGPATGSYSSVVTKTCDGGEGQKWNAPPGFTPAALDNVVEMFQTPS